MLSRYLPCNRVLPLENHFLGGSARDALQRRKGVYGQQYRQLRLLHKGIPSMVLTARFGIPEPQTPNRKARTPGASGP